MVAAAPVVALVATALSPEMPLTMLGDEIISGHDTLSNVSMSTLAKDFSCLLVFLNNLPGVRGHRRNFSIVWPLRDDEWREGVGVVLLGMERFYRLASLFH